MALNQPDRNDVVKAAANNDRLKDIKFSESLGHVLIGGDKYTDRAAAVRRLNEKK